MNLINNKRYLPFSIKKYYVNDHGDVFENETVIETFIKNNKEYVKIDWYNGNTEYEKALIVLSAFNKIDHDVHLYNKIYIIYRDGNTLNSFPENLLYVFQEPIESHIKDFYLIPGYKNYVISKNGDVYNLKSNKILNYYITKPGPNNKRPGYIYFSFQRDSIGVNIHQHRLLCLVFKPIPKDKIFKLLTVNHIDGVKSNNELSNLEWSTYSENNKHAWDNNLKFKSRNRVLMKDLLTNEIKSFRSLRECGRYLGDSTSFYVSQRLKNQDNVLYPDLKIFKIDDESGWPKINSKELNKFKGINSNNIYARNVFTGEIFIFNDALTCANELNIKTHIVLEHARLRILIPHQGYNFRYRPDINKWPKFIDKHLLVFKEFPIKPGDAVIMLDKETGKEKFFTSINNCVKEMGIAATHLETLMYTSRLFKKRYLFTRFNLKRNIVNYETISSEAT